MERYVNFDREGGVSDDMPRDGEYEGLDGGAGRLSILFVVIFFVRFVDQWKRIEFMIFAVEFNHWVFEKLV